MLRQARLVTLAAASSLVMAAPRSAPRVLDLLGTRARDLPASLPLFWFDEVESTMETARELLRSDEQGCTSRNLFGVLAGSQVKGRGTRGRTWLAGGGNLYLTLVLRKSALPSSLPLTLVPLRIGTLLYPIINKRVPADKTVELKWPNDVLLDNKKVSGILIEVENDRLLIGIGMNIMTAPAVPVESANADTGRPSTCIQDHNAALFECNKGEEVCSQAQQEEFLERVAQEISVSIYSWLDAGSDTAINVINEFSHLMQKKPQKLRNADERGAEVQPLSISTEGGLIVRYQNGTESTLLADYLY